MKSQTDGSPWSMRRATRGGGTEIPVTRPERLAPLDLAGVPKEWRDYMRKNRAANAEYELHPFAACSHRGYCKRSEK